MQQTEKIKYSPRGKAVQLQLIQTPSNSPPSDKCHLVLLQPSEHDEKTPSHRSWLLVPFMGFSTAAQWTAYAHCWSLLWRAAGRFTPPSDLAPSSSFSVFTLLSAASREFCANTPENNPIPLLPTGSKRLTRLSRLTYCEAAARTVVPASPSHSPLFHGLLRICILIPRQQNVVFLSFYLCSATGFI